MQGAENLQQERSLGAECTSVRCSYCSFLLVNLDSFEGFGRFGETVQMYIKIEAQEHYSLIDTIFNYIFDFGPPGKYL